MPIVKGLVQKLVAELRKEDVEYTFVDDRGYPGIAWKGRLFLSFFQGRRNIGYGEIIEWGVLAKDWMSQNNHISSFYTVENVKTEKERRFG